MMKMQQKTKRLRHDEQGATAVEFAIVSGVFFMMAFGMIEYGLIMYTKSAIDAVTYKASREVSVGGFKSGCTDRVDCIKKYVQNRSQGLINPQSVHVNAKVVTNSSTASPTTPDICVNDANPYAVACTRWEENNGVNGYQPAGALSSTSIGKAGDIVEVRVTYLWKVMFPIFRSKFGDNGVLTITASTVVKNEPFYSAIAAYRAQSERGSVNRICDHISIIFSIIVWWHRSNAFVAYPAACRACRLCNG